ncbi:MAG: exodeoxyribonuclease VII small subunit [Candidatus Brocadiaceae bacterium]|jgi:exodeoxyribonuclease VII small subunit
MSEEETTETQPRPEPADFEQSLKKLEEVVARLEEGNLPLDESLQLYEEGIHAYQQCQDLLQQADLKVRKLVETLEGELEEEPFEPPQASGED